MRSHKRSDTVDHPLHSANARFERLDKKLKSALSKNRGVPFEMIDAVEHRLRDFFTSSPNGVYIDVVDTAFARMFYHAVAGFLNLLSSSEFIYIIFIFYINLQVFTVIMVEKCWRSKTRNGMFLLSLMNIW